MFLLIHANVNVVCTVGVSEDGLGGCWNGIRHFAATAAGRQSALSWNVSYSPWIDCRSTPASPHVNNREKKRQSSYYYVTARPHLYKKSSFRQTPMDHFVDMIGLLNWVCAGTPYRPYREWFSTAVVYSLPPFHSTVGTWRQKSARAI